MPKVKTAISIREPLFKEVEALARQMDVSHSQLFVMAVEEFIQQHRNQQLLKQINRAYRGKPDAAERKRLSKMKSRQRQIVEGEW
jgi:metal-responsive CopG/Arc/MetJ family transcriptional regulator